MWVFVLMEAFRPVEQQIPAVWNKHIPKLSNGKTNLTRIFLQQPKTTKYLQKS